MKSKLGIGAIYLSISSVILMIAGYVVNIFLGKYLGPADYGMYGILISLMTAVNLMQTAGLPQAASKYIAEDESQADSILRSGLLVQMLVTALLTALFFLFATPLALLLHDLQLVPYIRLTAFIFPLYGLFALYTGYYNGMHNFKRQAYLNILYAVFKTLAVVGFVYTFHLFGALIGFIISPFFALIFCLHIPQKGTRNFPYKKLILFSLPLIGLAIFSNLLQSIDLFFVKALLHSNTLAGFYTASQNISRVPFYGILALSSVLFPSISKSVSQNLHDHAKRIIRTAFRFTLLFLLPTTALFAATSKQLITFLYSPQYQPGAASLELLLVGGIFFTFFTLLATIMSSSGSPKQVFLLSGIGVGITAFFCTVFIPVFGSEGAALATSCGAFLIMGIAFFMVYKKFKIFLPMLSTLKIAFSSVIIFWLAKNIMVPLLFLPFLYIVLFGMYILLLFLMKEFTRDDTVLAASLLPKWIAKKIL